ncbi:hypothetical protein BGW38_001060 [Lunasporangiospora selenospora]|uniref:Pentacotripeptide-repeat region of PRORP domain-containing protein n=1 Tax=Lunasporangiospora selenospora TaxID=979761 RepID=A0A9P6G2P2_9FUNG|nr:hypothetical protein BGW38_001060 [Lunasporangiospora selenospora]
MMWEAVASKNPQQIWHTFNLLTANKKVTWRKRKSDAHRVRHPFSPVLYNRILHSFQQYKKPISAKWALKVYEELSKFYTLRLPTLNCILDILVRHEDLDWAINFFKTGISKANLQPDTQSYNIIIRGLAGNGREEEARKIYDEMRAGVYSVRPDVATYSTLMNHYAKKGQLQVADSVLEHMFADKVKPNIWIFNSIVDRCVARRDYDGANKVISMMRESGLKPDVVTYTTLIDRYAGDGDEEGIARIQQEMAENNVQPNAQTITSIMRVFAHATLEGEIDERLESLLKSLPVGEMNDMTFGVLMNVYGKRKNLSAAMDIYQHIVSKGRLVNDVIVNSLLDGHVRAGDPQMASKIFHEHFTVRNTQPLSSWTYSIMITGCCKENSLNDALHYYHLMTRYKIEPDAISCSRMIQLFLGHHSLDRAQRMLQVMQSSNMTISIQTFTMLIDYMSKSKDMRGALRCYQQMLDAGIHPDVNCYTVLMNAFIREKNFAACVAMHERMVHSGIKPSLESLTTILHVHSIQGNLQKVREQWEAIEVEGFLPDHKAYTLLMQTYANLSNVEMVEFIYEEMQRKEIKIDEITLRTIVSSYATLPQLNLARIDEISSVMEKKDLVPSAEYFKVLMEAYGEHHMPDRLVKMWNHLQQLDTPLSWTPNTDILLNLIEACRDRGYIDTLHSVWHAATIGYSPITTQSTGGVDTPLPKMLSSSSSPRSTETIRTPIPITPAPEVFTAYLNALLTHNRFQEIEQLLSDTCREVGVMPRPEDMEFLFTGLAQYAFLGKELGRMLALVEQRWPMYVPLATRIVQGTRRI